MCLLVNSLGGSPSSAYETAMAIRKSYDDVTVFVPHIAAGGGTLLALIGSKIRTGTMSQLSPADIQVWCKNTFASTNLMLAAKQSLDKTLSMKSVGELAHLERRLADSFDPTVMEEFGRTADTGVAYLDTMLKATGYDEPKRETIIRKLIFSLPVHGFVIDGDLAGNIGTKVGDGNANVEEWKMMLNWCLKYIDQAEDNRFVRYAVPKKNGRQSLLPARVTPLLIRLPCAIVFHVFQTYARVPVGSWCRTVRGGTDLLVSLVHRFVIPVCRL